MDGGAWWAAVHGVAEGRTRLSAFTFWEAKVLIFISVWDADNGILIYSWAMTLLLLLSRFSRVRLCVTL